jgi:hypothetical protein
MWQARKKELLWWECLKEETYLKDLGVDGKIILEIFSEMNGT